jgi:hypothetical protein
MYIRTSGSSSDIFMTGYHAYEVALSTSYKIYSEFASTVVVAHHQKKKKRFCYCARIDQLFTYNIMFYVGLGRRQWVDGIGWVRMMTSKLGKR